MRRPGVLGIAAGVAGLVAAGAAVGLATEKYAIGRIRARPDPEADQPYGRLPPGPDQPSPPTTVSRSRSRRSARPTRR